MSTPSSPRPPAGVIAVVLLAALLPVGGCAELVRGPRVVHYDPAWFYVRHAPLDSRAAIDAIAWDECRMLAARPMMTDQLQVYPFDLRYAVYRCVIDTADGGTLPIAPAVLPPPGSPTG